MTGEPSDLTADLAFDRDHVWHPYAAIPAEVPPLLVTAARGTRLSVTTPDGRDLELIDAMSSWWAAIHGYSHPRLVAAATEQLERMSHVMFGGLTHEPAIRLARRLIEVTPAGLDRVFFADSGSVAVEVAIKMALQYWHARGRPERHRLLTWRSGYHGDTLFAMSVCDPDGGMHSMWRDVVPSQVFVHEPPAGVDEPLDDRFVAELSGAIERHAAELAAVIVEPVVQGAGGMRFHNPAYLQVLRDLCDRFDVLFIADEIATGFGRTGPMFGCDRAAVSPDILCLGKALTGGMMTLAATLCTAEVADAISAGGGVLAHGPTFMANPLACATALASIDELAAHDHRARVAVIEANLTAALAPAVGRPGVRDVRVLGAIGVIELDGPVDVAAATGAAVDLGVWIRPFRNLIYTMPPYVSTPADIAAIGAAMVAAATASVDATAVGLD